MSSYLVTGGAGFIGSHIVERLLKEGNSVRVLDNFITGKKENLSFVTKYKVQGTNYKLIEGDIRDPDTCRKAVEGVDFVLHQAALRSVPKSLNDPLSYNEVNVTGTLNLLLTSRDFKVKRFIYASSSSVYGETKKLPEKEKDLPAPISPYAASKLTGEYYCQIFSNVYNLETVCLRYFNVFGPKQSLESEYAVVVPKFINSILNGKNPPIYGDGKQSRDFTYVDNVVEANLLSCKMPKICGEVLNIASGRAYTVLELLKHLNRILGTQVEPEFAPRRPGDVLRTLADISKAQKLLKLEIKVNFEQGLKKTVEWFKEHKREYA